MEGVLNFRHSIYRVKAVLAKPHSSAVYRFGVFQVDLRRRELLRYGTRSKIQDKPFRLLTILLEQPGDIVTREELQHRLWSSDTFVEFNDGLNVAANKLRLALSDSAESPSYIETVPRQGYRFIAPVTKLKENNQILGADPARVVALSPDSEEIPNHGAAFTPPKPSLNPESISSEPEFSSAAVETSKGLRFWQTNRWSLPTAITVLVVLCSGGIFLLRFHRTKILTEKDTVVLADFANSTGDPAFDGTLEEALAVDLDQSPFLRVLSPVRVQKGLRYMGRSPGARLTTDLARDLCLRVGSKAMLSGSIASLGTQYILTLNAVNCQNGDSLARQLAEASNKEQVLSALGNAASKLRGKLGESLASVQEFDVPIEQVTTTSLDALKAFASGNAEFDRGHELESLPFYRRAVELDPNFAWVYARMAAAYFNNHELEQAKVYTRKAYQLKDRVSERERLYITKNYFLIVTGDLDKGIETLELYEHIYPSDEIPSVNLALCYRQVGDFRKAALAAHRSLLAGSRSANPYINLALSYAALGQPDEAQHTIEEALKQFPDSEYIQWISLWLAFAFDKPDEAQRLLTWAKDRPGEFRLLQVHADALQSEGKLRLSSEVTHQALEMEQGQKLKEVESSDLGRLALVQADFGLCERARKHVEPLLTSKSQDGAVFAGLVAATCGEGSKANSIASELGKKYPLATFIKNLAIPQIRARIELQQGNGARAIDQLRPTESYQFGYVAAGIPAYLRGLAYLRANHGSQAVTEFQKILDHKCALGASPYVSLAKLGLARGFALSGDSAKARAAYQDFLTKWKDADSDIIILKHAQTEYAKLQ
jgi:DNA-binding winged helix-turn-helix (wHTH) protein/Tfp pilus assembly protein PilF